VSEVGAGLPALTRSFENLPLPGGNLSSWFVLASNRIWKKCNRAAKVQNPQKIILFILKILLILSYWNIATSVQTKPQPVLTLEETAP